MKLAKSQPQHHKTEYKNVFLRTYLITSSQSSKKKKSVQKKYRVPNKY